MSTSPDPIPTQIAPWHDPDSLPLQEDGAIRSDGTPTIRTRRPLKAWERATDQQLFLKLYFKCGSITKAALRARLLYSTVSMWQSGIPQFKVEMDEIKAMWVEIRDLQLEDRDIRAWQALDNAINQTKDMRLATEAAMKYLRSRGQMPEKGVIEHVGKDGGPIRILEVVVERRVREVIDVKSTPMEGE